MNKYIKTIITVRYERDARTSGGDTVVDAYKLYSYFDGGDIACNDCNFSQGEKISEFRADLTGENDLTQMIKAYKKARIYTSQGKNIKMNDIINYDKITHRSMGDNGWKFNWQWSKEFPNGKELVSLSLTPNGNQTIHDVYRVGRHIGIFQQNAGNIPNHAVSLFQFKTQSWNWSKILWEGYISNFKIPFR